MSRVYDNVRREIEQQLLKEAHGIEESNLSQGEEKPFTLRCPQYMIHSIDAMAALLHQSRNAFINDLLVDAMNDAIDGYCHAFGAEHADGARTSFFDLVSKLHDGLLKPRDIRDQEDDE